MAGGRANPADAWRAASEAVLLVTGARPPQTAGVLRGGRRCDRATAWRRQLAIYTAAVSLNAGVKPLVEHTGVSRALVRKILGRMEESRDDPAIDELLDVLARAGERRMGEGAA